MQDVVKSLLEAGILAPSGDNTQPWRFRVNAAGETIVIGVDETRDPSPMNSGQRMSRIAVGAVIENMLETARVNKWEVEVKPLSPPDLIGIEIHSAKGGPGQIPEVLRQRVTNRCLYEGRVLPDEVLARLIQATPVLEGVETHWIVNRTRLTELASLVGRADAMMFGEPVMRQAFLSKVRFDVPAATVVEEGLSVGSLELSASDRLALRMMPYLPDWLLKLGGAMKVMADKTRKLVESASGLCLTVAPDARDEADISVGKVMQRSWLTLTAENLAVQPMMSLLVLENAAENGPADLRARLGDEKLASLRRDLRTRLPEIGTGRPSYLMRFGYGPPPRIRVSRLPLEASTTES